MSDAMTKRPAPVFAIPDQLKAVFAGHLALYRRYPGAAHFDGRPVDLPGRVATAMLTTYGRNSGEPRAVTLQYFRKGNRVPRWLRTRPICDR